MAVALRALCKVLADRNRVRITKALTESDLCVCELADVLNMRQTTLSNHLAKMRAAGIVEARRDGTWIYYRIAPEALEAVTRLLQLFEADIRDDSDIARDLERLRSRLAMRVNGRCMRSYGQLKENNS